MPHVEDNVQKRKGWKRESSSPVCYMKSILFRVQERVNPVKGVFLAGGDLIYLEKGALAGPEDEPEFKEVA